MDSQQEQNSTPDATATPRTDVAIGNGYRFTEGVNRVREYVPANFARTLERELSSAQAALTAAKAEIERANKDAQVMATVADNATAYRKELEADNTALRAEVERLR